MSGYRSKERGAEMLEVCVMIALGVALAAVVVAFTNDTLAPGLKASAQSYYSTLYGGEPPAIDPIKGNAR